MKKIIMGVAALVAGFSFSTAQAETIKIGTEGAYPPFNFTDASGEIKGFEIDLTKAICDEMKVKCEFVLQDWDGMIPALLIKKYDAIAASMSITEERKKKVLFSEKYYNTPGRFVGPKGSKIDFTKEGLKGKAVGVQTATVHLNYLEDNYDGIIDLKIYDTLEKLNRDVINGRVDLGFADSIVLLDSLLKTEEGKKFEFLGPELSDPKWFGDGIGFALRKEDSALAEKLNKAIKAVRANGTYAKINQKYFPFDVYGK